MKMPLTTEQILARYKMAGMSNQLIANKMGLSVEDVIKRWDAMVEASRCADTSGHSDLIQQMNIMCAQYQLLGESLKVVCEQIARAVPPSELKLMVEQNVEETTKNILSRCIVLKKFTLVDTVETLKKHMKQVSQDN